MQSAELEILITAEDSDIDRAQKKLDELNRAVETGAEFDIDGTKAERDILNVIKVMEKAIAAAESGAEVDIATKDAEKSLKKLGELAEKSGEKLGDAYEDAAKVVKDKAAKMKKDLDAAFDTKSTGLSDLGKNVKAETKEASRAMEDLGDEAKQNLAETVSSFDGSASSMVEMVQGTVGGAISALGPVGMAAGAAIGIGIGLAMSAFEGMAEKVNEQKEEVNGLVGEMQEAQGGFEALDMGSKLSDWGKEIQNARSWFDFFQEDAIDNFEHLQTTAEKAGEDFGQIWRTFGADGSAGLSQQKGKLQDLRAELDRLNDAYLDVQTQDQAGAQIDYERAASLRQQRDAQQELVNVLEERVEVSEEALDRYLAEETAEYQLTEAQVLQRDAIRAFNEEAEKKVEGLLELNDIEGLHAEALEGSGEAMDAYNEKMEEQLGLLDDAAGKVMSAAEAQADYQETLAGMSEQQAKINELMAQGQTVINAAGDGFNTHTEAGRLAQKAMFDFRDSMWAVIETQREQGASSEELENMTIGMSAAFQNQARDMGFSSAAASDLASSLSLIPSEVASTAIVEVERDELDTTVKDLDAEEGKKRKTIWEIVTEGLATAQAAVGVQKKAGGGYVTGGIPDQDSVPIMAMPGEFVLRKSAAQALGPDVLTALNSGQLPSGANGATVTTTNGGPSNTELAATLAELTNVLATLQSQGIQATIGERQFAEGANRARTYSAAHGGY